MAPRKYRLKQPTLLGAFFISLTIRKGWMNHDEEADRDRTDFGPVPDRRAGRSRDRQDLHHRHRAVRRALQPGQLPRGLHSGPGRDGLCGGGKRDLRRAKRAGGHGPVPADRPADGPGVRPGVRHRHPHGAGGLQRLHGQRQARDLHRRERPRGRHAGQ